MLDDHQMHDVDDDVSSSDGNELVSILASLSLDFKEIKSTLHDKQLELALTTEKLSSATGQLASATGQLETARASISVLRDELNIKNRKVNELKEQKDEMETKLNKANDTIATMLSLEAKNDNERSNFESSLSNANQMIVEMETKLKEAQDNIWSLDAEICRLRDKERRYLDTMDDMRITMIQERLSFLEGEEESDDEESDDDESDEESVGHDDDVHMSANKRCLPSGPTSSSIIQASKRARPSSTGSSTATSSTAALSTGSSTATSSTAALSLTPPTNLNHAAAEAIASMTFLHDPNNPQQSYSISELMQPEVQQLIKEQQTQFMYAQLKLIESPTDRMLSRSGRQMFKTLMKNGGGVLRRLFFYASHSKFQRYITVDILGGFFFPKGIGMKLMIRILGIKKINDLITILRKLGFKFHPLNAGIRVRDRCSHINRFIHEGVKMNADLSGITYDETNKGNMQVAVVVGEPLVDLKYYLESQLSNVGNGKDKERRKRIYSDIFQRLKGVDDEDTKRILNTFGQAALRKCYKNVLPLSGRTREDSVTTMEDMITALVTATATQ